MTSTMTNGRNNQGSEVPVPVPVLASYELSTLGRLALGPAGVDDIISAAARPINHMWGMILRCIVRLRYDSWFFQVYLIDFQSQ